MLALGPAEEELVPFKHVDLLVLHVSLPSPWPRSQGNFSDSESKRDSAGPLFRPGWGGRYRSACSLWRVGVCLHNLISTLKMLLFICTVGELEFSPMEMILSYIQYLFYFKGARFNFVVKLKCLSCLCSIQAQH